MIGAERERRVRRSEKGALLLGLDLTNGKLDDGTSITNTAKVRKASIYIPYL
jgi:hypothetical protein